MKKLLIILMNIILALSLLVLSGCGGDEQTPDVGGGGGGSTDTGDCSHSWGDWALTSSQDTYCEDRTYTRTCTDCGRVEEKQGADGDHNFTVTTVEPTCIAEGYDTHTCTKCGKTLQNDNFTSPTGIHTADSSGFCTVCKRGVAMTEGLEIEIAGYGRYATVVGYHGSSTAVNVPAEYEGVPVTMIADNAFAGSSELVRVDIPDSITDISGCAFSDCDSLEYNVYEGCNYLGNSDNPYYAVIGEIEIGSGEITIHEDTVLIADAAFAENDAVTSVTIPSGVRIIGDFAFTFCDELESISIPDSVKMLGGVGVLRR